MEEVYDRIRKDLATLSEYQESKLWQEDYEADERGELPKDLKRGVLSQDALDDLFESIRPEQVGKCPVITLCGSTRFKEQFLEAQKRLTLAGNIVISVGLFGHSGDDEVWSEGTKEMHRETLAFLLFIPNPCKPCKDFVAPGKSSIFG